VNLKTMLRRLAIVFVLLGALPVRSDALIEAENTWSPIGPQFSTVLALEHDPERANIMLAGTYFGGLYRSTDYGFTWQHVIADFSSRSIFSISYPSTSIIYIASFRGGVYRSKDGGASWMPVNDGLTDLDVQVVAADPSDPNIVMAATSNGGLFRSVNGGESWTQLTGNALTLRGRTIAFDPLHQSIVYLGTIGQGLFKSVDGGLTFQPFSDGITATSVFSLRFGAPPSRELYAATDNGAFKLRSGAETWTNISGDLPQYPLSDILPHPLIEHMVFAATLVGVFMIPNDDAGTTWTGWTNVPTRTLLSDPTGSVFHAGSIHGGMQATIDFGQNWYPANSGIQNLFIGAIDVVAGGPSGSLVYAGSDFAIHRSTFGSWETFFDQKQGVFDIQSDPSNPATLYIGTERSGVWKSTDGGSAWLPSSTNLVPAQIYSLGQSADGKTLFAGTSSGLYLSPNNGDYWVLGNAAQLGIVLSVAPDPTRHPFLFVGGADGQVLRSEDGGWSYHDASNGLPRENIVGLVTAPWEKTYAITSGGGLFATSDDGRNWFAAKSGVADPALAIAADPQRPWILYMGTSGGGVYKSESGSLDWTRRDAGLTSPFVFSLAVDPESPATLYAGTLEGVFRSSDGATSWIRRSTGLATGAVTALLVDATNPKVVYASVQNAGLYRSSDGAESWTSISGTLPVSGAIPIAINRQSSSQLFAGTSLNGVYRSSDSGASWQQSNFGMSLFVRGLAIDPATTSTLYAGSLGAGVFKSTDAGQSWNNVGLRDRNVFKLAVDPQHTGTVYAATSRGLNRSTNGGETWRELGQRAAFVNAMVVDPRDRRRVFIGTTAGSVYRSNDGGDTWDNANSGLPPYTVLALAIDATDGTLYAAPERQGIWRSTDDGKSWTLLSGGLFDKERVSSLTVGPDHKVYAASLGAGVLIYADHTWTLASTGLASPNVADVKVTSAGSILAATFDAGVFRSVNGGMNWTWVSSGLTTSRVTSLTTEAANPSSVYAATPDGVFTSNDDGQTWHSLNTGMPGVNTWSVLADPSVPNHLFAATNGQGVYRSNDSGSVWNVSNTGLTNLDVRTISAGPTPGSLYAATLGGGIARSSDGGLTWSGGVTIPLVDSFVLAVVVNPVDTSIVYTGTAGRGILKSTNGGLDWMPVNNGLGSLFILSLALDKQHPDTLYAGTADLGVYYSTDGGSTWHVFNDGLFNHVVTSIAIDPADSSRIYAGTEGGGVFANQVALPHSPCTFMIPSGTLPVNSAATEITVNVSTTPGCDWRVESPSDWLTVTGEPSRTGSGTVNVSVAGNDSQDARSGLISVAGHSVLVVQRGSAALFRLSVTPVGNGSGSVVSDALGIHCGTDCQHLFSEQIVVTMAATPNQGSRFVAWEGDSDCADGKVIMVSDHACIARFEQTDDFDGDGLPNMWEVKFGLDPGSTSGDNGPDGDPDHDGQTNTQELENGTHPRGFFTRYFAAGLADSGHDTRLALFNAMGGDARVLVRLIPDAGDATAEYRFLVPLSRATVDTANLAGLIEGGFAVVIESDQTVVAEETITQISPSATDGEPAAAASSSWYAPGGTTRDGRTTDYSIFNPGPATIVRITYLPSGAPPVFREHAIDAGKRLVVGVGTDTGLAEADIASVLVSDTPIVVESTVMSGSGDAALTTYAAPAPSFLQFLADMRTGPLVTSTIDLLNPAGNSSEVTMTYVLSGGGIVQHTYLLGAYSQASINPADEDFLLSEATFGVIASASSPMTMSGSTWWPGSRAADWYEGGSTRAEASAGTRWAIAGGEVGGSRNSETEISVMNVAPMAGTARIRLVFDDRTSVTRDFQLPAVGQTNINVAQAFPEAVWKTFSILVESLPAGETAAPDIVVESTTYTSSDNLARSGGTRIGATLLSTE
jgi:photosystem II stability/assembly factor-like uncharacterized protein